MLKFNIYKLRRENKETEIITKVYLTNTTYLKNAYLKKTTPTLNDPMFLIENIWQFCTINRNVGKQSIFLLPISEVLYTFQPAMQQWN